ncbi:MAG: CoA transferase subunit A [Firmicutes bacterium]|nr:CoA transferase subunit A [Bacillota bacterium]
MPKFTSVEEAAKLIKDGDTIMIGGFLGCGSPDKLCKALAETGVKDLTLICNDGGFPEGSGPTGQNYGAAWLIANHQIKKIVATHVGINPNIAKQNFDEKTLEVCLIPQGSFAEMIRAGGAGLGAVLTPTGVGTLVEESPYCLGKETINGREYLKMAPLHADFALLEAYKVDKMGNCWYKGTTQTFNIVMGTAADTVIVEAENVVEVGDIAPEDVRTFGMLVDYVVE